jgi:malonate-semialdehyde dehydrogenase (acetylating) / methylmalonate-semialdehyde dehydrogenase
MIPTFEGTSYDFRNYVKAQNVIGGSLVDGSAGESLDVINPRFAKAMSTCPMSAASDVDDAVTAAKKALPQWSSLPIRDRAQVLYRYRDLMLENLDELCWLVTHENGKTFEESKGEVLKGVECVEFSCSLPNLAAGRELEVSAGVVCKEIHEPLGIVAGVTPFNFPNMVPLWMIPNALVAGNCFILKPSEQTPLSAMRIASMLQEAGLPDGALNVVQGAKQTVEALCDHPDIRALAFVGSTPVARAVYGRAAQSGKRALCLGGAKNHLIMVPDAEPAMTAQNVVASFTGCAGQRCMAASVLVAVGGVDHIVNEIVAQASQLEPGRNVGAIVNAQSQKRIEGYIAQAQELGAKLLLDGREPGNEEGYWVGPTILDQMTPEIPGCVEEIFGPVLSIVRVDSLEDALELENKSPFGNASSVYTSSGYVADKVMDRVSAGMCGVNIGVPVPREPFAFGGWNHSKFGHGDVTGWDGFRFFSQPRKITVKWELHEDATWMS